MKGMIEDEIAVLRRGPLHVPHAMCEAYDYPKPSAFSRGMAVELAGARLVFVSGTASVGPNGETLHPGDFRAQARRAFENARAVLKGRHVHADVRLLVVPASRDVYLEALESGIVHDLVEAGAMFSNPSCGACFGGHIGLLAPGEVGLTTSNRNFKGRQGSPEALVYLASPAVTAASAVTGEITDPRDL